MKNISFTKMSGAGNDFIVIDKTGNPGIALAKSDIQRLCDRRNGIGADGIILISNANGYDFSMDYFNADGSTGSLCGNGARCAIKYANSKSRINGKSANFVSNNIAYAGEILENGLVKFDLNSPEKIVENLSVSFSGFVVTAGFVNTGSPHVVIDVKDLKEKYSDSPDFIDGIQSIPVVRFGREIRYDPEFKPDGTNINFFEVIEGIIHIRTYERGVEDETLACGTGSVASAILASVKYNLISPIRLFTKGSDELMVDFKLKGSEYRDVTLTGPAKDIFSGEISL